MANYRRASSLRQSLVSNPVTPDNPTWIASLCVQMHSFRVNLGFATVALGWESHDRTHQRLGDSFVLVTPDRNGSFVGQAEAL